MSKKWKREDITPEVLRQLLRLDEDTGKLYWRERGPEWFSSTGQWKIWNKRFSGKEAFGGGDKGAVMGVNFQKEVIVHAMKFGEIMYSMASGIDARDVSKSEITVEDLKKMFELRDGVLFHRERPIDMFKTYQAFKSWNGKNAGKAVAVQERPDGTRMVSAFLTKAYVHDRLVAALKGGEFVTNEFWVHGDLIALREPHLAGKGAFGYRGVSFSKSQSDAGRSDVYQAQCANIHLGFYDTPIEAARAYDKAAFAKYGEHARLNFPEDYGLVRADTDAPDGYFD